MEFSRVLNQFAKIGSSTLLTLLYDQLLMESTSWGEVCPSSSSFLGSSASISKSAEHSSEFPSSSGTSSNENGDGVSSSSAGVAASSSSAFRVVNMFIKPSKVCPDFKDDLDQSACCPSQINHGAYFCCTEEYREQLQWELDREAWRQFVKSFSHILEIVIGAVLLVISVIIIATVLCKRLAFCPLHRSKMLRPTDTNVAPFHGFGANRYSFASNGRYHHHHRPLIPNYAFQQRQQQPVAPIQQQQQSQAVVHKPPPFEAPPPYDFATAPRYDSGIESVGSSSGRLMNAAGGATTTQRTENWNYLTENEMNDIHEAVSGGTANQTIDTPNGDNGAAQTSVPITTFLGSC